MFTVNHRWEGVRLARSCTNNRATTYCDGATISITRCLHATIKTSRGDRAKAIHQTACGLRLGLLTNRLLNRGRRLHLGLRA
jgi:hypothetical protein